jgi:hypothetical protein
MDLLSIKLMVEAIGLNVLVSGGEVKKLDVNSDTKIMLRDDLRFLALQFK